MKKRAHNEGHRLRKMRKERDLTLSKLSEEMAKSHAKVTPQYLGKIENGVIPSTFILHSLLDVLGCSPGIKVEMSEAMEKYHAGIVESPRTIKSEIKIYESEVKQKGKIEVWFISSNPIGLFDNDIFTWILDNIKSKTIKFTYWVPIINSARFWTLLRKFQVESKKNKSILKKINEQVQYIETIPETAFFPCIFREPREKLPSGQLVTLSSSECYPGINSNEVSIPSEYNDSYGDYARSQLFINIPTIQVHSILNHLRPIYEKVTRFPSQEFNGYRLVFPANNNND